MTRTILLIFTVLALSSSYLYAAADKDIADVIDMYIAGKPADAMMFAMDKTDEFSGEKTDPAYLILSYLSGTMQDMKPVALASEKKPEMWALASMSFFVRNLAVTDKPDSFELQCNLQNYKNASLAAGGAVAARWKDSVEIWIKWCEDEFNSSSPLPPLLLSKSNSASAGLAAQTATASSTEDSQITSDKTANQTSTSISAADLAFDMNTVSAATVCGNNALFAKRPRPLDYEFNSDEVSKYLASIGSETARKAEERRYKFIADIKDSLIKTFERNAFEGSVKTRKGQQVSGTVAIANQNALLVRNAQAGKSTKLTWKELDPAQIPLILTFFADQRLKVIMGNVPVRERQRDAAIDYLRAAVFADWYGDYEGAADCFKKAVEIYPPSKAAALKLFRAE